MLDAKSFKTVIEYAPLNFRATNGMKVSEFSICPVIMAGSSGTRLWPLSRKQYPEQYLPLVSDNPMQQKTILRLNGLGNLTPVLNHGS
jgi:hypothetical protein